MKLLFFVGIPRHSLRAGRDRHDRRVLASDDGAEQLAVGGSHRLLRLAVRRKQCR
jgi:hypothetical protein